MSTASEAPSLDTAEWLSDVDGDDTVCLYACNPNATVSDLTIYVGIATASDVVTNFSVVATQTFQTGLIALSAVAFSSSSYLTSYRTFSLDCPLPIGNVDCSFAVYPSCRVDGYGCCDRFRPIPPTADPSPLWPWDESDPTFPSISIPFDDFEPLEQGKLAFAVTLRRFSQDAFFAPISSSLQYEQLKQCTIEINGGLFDSAGVGVVESISFVEESLPCSTAALASALNEINATISAMYHSQDGPYSLLLHHRLSILLGSKEYRACQSFVNSLLTFNASASAKFSSSSSCFAAVGSVAFATDPCCNQTLAFTQCCAVRDVSFPIGEPSLVNTNAVNSACGAAICSTKALQNYMQTQAASSLPKACDLIQREYDTEISSTDLVQFVYDCQLSTVGANLRGLPCANNSQCSSGTCTKGRCTFSTDAIINCLVDRMPVTVARFLLLNWGLGGLQLSSQRMRSELQQRVVSPQCFGRDAIKYRSHYWFHTEILCDDECLGQDLEPRCFDTNTCPVNPLCERPNTLCTRFWEPVKADLDSCAEQRVCNWMDCGDLSPDDCAASCVNSSLSVNACLRCPGDVSEGECAEVAEIVDSGRCAIGLCSANESISDPTQCSQSGYCSLDCPSCSTKSGCESSGSCSDAEAIADFAVNGGVCLQAFSLFDGAVGCENSSLAVPSGCVVVDYETPATCSAAGLRWHALAQNASACAALSNACFGSDGLVTLKNESQCGLCGAAWRPVYAWTAGAWTSGRMVNLTWQPRAYLNSTYIASSVDFYSFRAMITNAISTKFSVTVASDAQCRYGAELRQVSQVSCDCSSGGARGLACYTNQALSTSESSGWACPFLAANITSRTASLILSASSVNSSSCTAVNIQVVPALQFKLDVSTGGLSSAVFQRSTTNPYAIVTNSEGLYVGQLLSDGVNILTSSGAALKLDGTAQLCILKSDAITDVDSTFSTIGFATLQDDSSIRPISNLAVAQVGQMFCTSVSSTAQIHFAVALEPTWEYSSSQVQYIIGYVLYIIVAALGLFQGLFVIFVRTLAWERKLLFISFTFVFQIRAHLIIVFEGFRSC